MNAVTLADAMQYFPYSQTLSVTGGTAPLSWSVIGSLPAGLSLNAYTGVISGTPTGTTGTSNFTIQVADSNSATNTQALSISVYPPDCTGTPEGNTVSIRPHYEVGLTFEEVTASGITCADRVATIRQLSSPAGYTFRGPEPTFLVVTEANYLNFIEVCLDYNPAYYESISSLRLFHHDGISWVDVTTSVDTIGHVVCGLTPSFSPFAIGEEMPTAITLSDFQALKIDGQLVINWTTHSEVENWGFRLLRSESADGPFVPVSQDLIPARGGIGLTMSYNFVDSSADINKTYFYQLEDVNTHGLMTLHAAVAVQDLSETVAKSSTVSTSHSTNKLASTSSAIAVPNLTDPGVVVLLPNAVNSVPAIEDVQGSSSSDQDMAEATSDESPVAANISPSSRPVVARANDAHLMSTPLQDVAAAIYTDTPSAAFSVSIKDAQGHIINVSRGAVPDAATDIRSTEISVHSENGSTEVSWQVASKQVRGFVLHRRKNGETEYQTVVKYIPNYGDNDTAVYNYNFIDNDNNDGRAYQYRLEVLNWGIETARHR
jgi:hypothetical protein